MDNVPGLVVCDEAAEVCEVYGVVVAEDAGGDVASAGSLSRSAGAAAAVP